MRKTVWPNKISRRFYKFKNRFKLIWFLMHWNVEGNYKNSILLSCSCHLSLDFSGIKPNSSKSFLNETNYTYQLSFEVFTNAYNLTWIASEIVKTEFYHLEICTFCAVRKKGNFNIKLLYKFTLNTHPNYIIILYILIYPQMKLQMEQQ